MRKTFTESNIAIIGGGRVCKELLKIILDPRFDMEKPNILGVADIDTEAKGLKYAGSKGLYTSADYRDLFQLEGLDTIIELTGDNRLLQILKRHKPRGVRLIDHFEAMTLWDYLQIEVTRQKVRHELRDFIIKSRMTDEDIVHTIEEKFEEYSDNLTTIIRERTRHLQSAEKNLIRRDRTISQIVEGNTIPTFVIDNKHLVTHWNKALERISGIKSGDIVGTRDHWKAFYSDKQPCMADLIVSGRNEEDIRKYYGDRFRPSVLIRGAYEAEGFFPDLGDSGRWLFFTAAPIRGITGKIMGSIETLWDTTAGKDAQHKLEEIEALEASILDAIHIAVLVLRERRIIFANEAVASVFGWKPEEVIGKSTRIIYRSDREYEEIGGTFYDALAVQRVHSHEFFCRRKDGREIICMIRTSRIGERLKERAIVATYEDITERKAAEKELIQREKTLAQIIQGSTIPTFVIDKNHTVIHWNKALERLTGNRADEIVGTNRHWKAFYAEEKPIMADLIVDRVDEKDIQKYYGERGRESPLIKGAYEAEDFFPHIGENGRWLYFTAAPLEGPDGSIIGAIETLWDTTDSKSLQDEREKHIRQLSSLWEFTSALSETLDLEESLRTAVKGIINNLYADSVGVYLKKEGIEFFVAYSYGYRDSMYHKGSGVGPDTVIEAVSKTGQTVIFENVTIDNAPYREFVLREDLKSAAYVPLVSNEGVFGVIRISSHSLHRFSEEDKNLLAIIINRVAVAIENARLHHEIKMYGQSLEEKVKEKTTELEESYSEIQRSEEKYRTMFDADPNPIIIADRYTFRILDVNATALDCYGFSREEFLEMSFVDLSYQKDNEVIEGLNRSSAGQSSFYPKRIHKKKNGLPFYVNVHIRVAQFMGRECFIATTPDVTENVEKETQLIQASKMATLGTMASGIAHEINQPLNVIQVCSDYFRKMIDRDEKIKNEDLLMMTEEISNNVQRAAQTIKHMRDFSRQTEVRTDQIDITRPLTDVFKILGQQLRVHKIDVEMTLAEGLPLIRADHNRLEQVFINLVTNAMDALDEKESQGADRKIKKILKIETYHANNFVVVTVNDNGTGIPEEIRDKVFEPFFTTKELGKGTGLGMSISYGIIKDYGGSIEVESEVGTGTTFTLTFPVTYPPINGDGNE